MPATRIENEVKIPKPSEMELARETSLHKGDDLHSQIQDGQEQMNRKRLDALNELTTLSQELGLYDDEH